MKNNNKLLIKLKEEIKSPHIPLALATGACVIIMAYFSKKILSKPIGYIPLAIIPFFMMSFEALYNGKYKDHWICKTWIWVMAIFISTAIIILLYLF